MTSHGKNRLIKLEANNQTSFHEAEHLKCEAEKARWLLCICCRNLICVDHKLFSQMANLRQSIYRIKCFGRSGLEPPRPHRLNAQSCWYDARIGFHANVAI